MAIEIVTSKMEQLATDKLECALPGTRLEGAGAAQSITEEQRRGM